MEGFLFEIRYFSVLIENFAGFAAVSCFMLACKQWKDNKSL